MASSSTDRGNLALASESLGFLQEPKQIIAMIGMTITFCMLWALIVFILYRIARIAL